MSAHLCHWPKCPVKVHPSLWGCSKHWFMLPIQIRDAILREYRPGQEITKTPSERYVVVAALAQLWIKDPGYVQGFFKSDLTKRTHETKP